MSCCIYVLAQRRQSDGTWHSLNVDVWPDQHYGLYGWLADVRNYAAVAPLSAPRGLPEDFAQTEDSPWLGEHSHSWVSMEELESFDYDQVVEDREITVEVAPKIFDVGLAVPGEGRPISLRNFLESAYFDGLERAKQAGAERLVFGFDG